MLSQVLPDTSVIPTYRASMPMSALPRVRSASQRHIGNSLNTARNDFNSTSMRWPNPKFMQKDTDEEDIAPYHRRDYSRSYDVEANYSDEEDFNSDSTYSMQPKNAPSVYEVVRAKNTNERLNELEKTNLNLRRMLDMLAANRDGERERVSSAKLLSHRETYLSKLGPPLLRQGRIGSTWRHIKQTNNYSNSNLLFVDGTVRINDSARYPPRVYGYPPKNLSRENSPDRNRDLLGLNSASLRNMDFPIESSRNKTVDLAMYDNPFHTRAKQGFEYWTKDKRIPENNKPKAKTIAIGYPYFKSGF